MKKLIEIIGLGSLLALQSCSKEAGPKVDVSNFSLEHSQTYISIEKKVFQSQRIEFEPYTSLFLTAVHNDRVWELILLDYKSDGTIDEIIPSSGFGDVNSPFHGLNEKILSEYLR